MFKAIETFVAPYSAEDTNHREKQHLVTSTSQYRNNNNYKKKNIKRGKHHVRIVMIQTLNKVKEFCDDKLTIF